MANDVATIAAGLTKAQQAFLRRVCDGQKPGLADREEDRARQGCRRLGLVVVVKNPRRWVATPLGLAVRAYLATLKDTDHG